MIEYLVLSINNNCLDKQQEILESIKRALEQYADIAKIEKVTFYTEETKPEEIKKLERIHKYYN